MNEEQLLNYLKKYFVYYDDGPFVRTDRRNSNGVYDKDGYLKIKIKQKQYFAHRLVWLFHNGHLPKGEIDHINRVRTDNRIENLREATRQQNINNTTRYPNKDTGEFGIHIDNTKGLKKRYAFAYKGKTYRYRSLEEAKKERRKLYGSL